MIKNTIFKKYRNTLIVTISVLNFLNLSCKPNKDNFKYIGNLDIAEKTTINDSIIQDKTFECIAKVKVVNNIQEWTKFYYNKVYKKLNEPIAYVYDTTVLKLKTDKQFEIINILNWNGFYKNYKRKIERYIETYSIDERELVKPFIESVAYDSLLIVSKNLKDIQLYNYGLKYLQNPDEVKKNVKITIKNNLTKLIFKEKIPKENLDYTISKLSENITSNNGKNKINSPIMESEIIIINKTNRIIYAEQTITIKIERNTIKHKINITGTK